MGSSNNPCRSDPNDLQKADGIAKGLVEAGIDGSIRQWVEKGGLEVAKNISEAETKTGQPWKESLGEFPALVEELERGKNEYYIIGGGGSENQLLVILNLGNEELNELSGAYAKALPGEKGRERRKQRLPMLIINHAEAGNIPEIPKEVVEEIEEEAESSFFWSKWSRVRKTKKTVKELAGWHLFSVEMDLANIQQLKSEMSVVAYFRLDTEAA